MSLARMSMTHRATIERDTNVDQGEDPWGNDDTPDWQSHITTPCRFWFDGGSTVTAGDKVAEVETRKMIIPEKADVTEHDRVTSIKDRLGNELAPGVMRIDSVGRRQGHKVCIMVEVK